MAQSAEDPKLHNDCLTPPIIVAHHPPPTSRSDGARIERRTRDPYIRLAIVTGILMPIAAVPYLLSRRRISGLQRRCEDLESKLKAVERRLSAGISESSDIRNEQVKMRAMLHDMMHKTDEIQRDAIQHVAKQSQITQAIQSDLGKLLEETQQTR